MNIKDIKVGVKVHYTDKEGNIEDGIIKSFSENKRLIYVVYNCDNNWSEYYNYIGNATYLDDLTLGWKVNSEYQEKENLIIELAVKTNSSTIAGMAILNAIKSGNFSADEILQYVKEQATDSPKTMIKCIGQELTSKILNFQI